MKHMTMFAATAAFAAFAVHADTDTPSVSDVSLSQDATRAVTINYTLADAPAIITLDITTNGVSIGQQNVWAIDGDANKVVQPGTRSMVWHPDKSWPDQKFVASDGIEVGAVVTAWATNDPPMYLAADLVSGGVKYYTCAEAVPGGVQDILYKTTTLLMRRIYARGKAFMMGSPSNEPGRWDTDARETQHEVSFSHDYYMGVYEVTQQQWNQIATNWPSYHSNAAYRPTRPVENVTWALIRGASTYYPDAPIEASFLYLLRTKTGLAFDLPGAAQWEYACKAGNGDYKWGDGTALDSGLKGTNPTDYEDPAYNALGRNAYNNATGEYKADNSEGALSTKDVNADTTCGTAAVGSYRPNSWGLYDMHGNVYEPCQDAYGDKNTNPYLEVPATSSNASRTRKGGSFQRGPFRHRASYQLSWDGKATQDTGIRVALTLD